MSLASQEDKDLNKVSILARRNTKDPIKISFRDINYRVRVQNAAEERRLTGVRHKELHVLKNCSGVLFPG